MAILLEGGCRIVRLRETEPVADVGLRVWPLVGRASGARDLSLRLLEFEAVASTARVTAACDDLWYVLSGEATLQLNGTAYPIDAETGVYLKAGSRFGMQNSRREPLVILSARCPEPAGEGLLEAIDSSSEPPRAGEVRPSPVVRLRDRTARPTGDRWYRVLVDDEAGSHRATQFVGSIPPGRAPDHYHAYEEVLCILSGTGTLWAGTTHAPLGAGSCVYLPRGQVHCVENTGRAALVLLGVFYPAGSPAVRYETDTSAGATEGAD